MLPEELEVVVELVVVLVLPLLLGFSPSQPTMMPKPNSKANAKIFFIFSTSNPECTTFSPEPFRRYLLDTGL